MMSALPLLLDVKRRRMEVVRLAQCHLRICDIPDTRLLQAAADRGDAQPESGERMQPIRFTEQFKTLLGVARRMAETADVEAILLLLEGPAEWARI